MAYFGSSDGALVFGYIGYSLKTEHQEHPLTKTYFGTFSYKAILDPKFPLMTHRCFDMVKTLEREIVHGTNQIDTWSNLFCKKNKVTNELLIIDKLAKDPPCSLNRDHGPIEC